MDSVITMDYGSGGTKTSELIERIFVPAFSNPALDALGDGAVLAGGERLVFSTDSFVVSPWKFPGGDIGKLAVCGTVNDVSMAGGDPKYLSLSFILEEGFSVEALREIVASAAETAARCGVRIVTGDTKVVERGKGDQVYINTSGIGFLRAPGLGRAAIRPGDAVLVSGPVGCHGAAVMMARGELPCEGELASDCMPLHELSRALIEAAGPGGLRIMRDPTRGGLATTLNEFVEGTALTIEIAEEAVPVTPGVRAACGLLGLDPLYCACEGRLVAVVDGAQEKEALAALRALPGGQGAARIGQVTEQRPGRVVLRTGLGGSRLLGKLAGGQLPRIC